MRAKAVAEAVRRFRFSAGGLVGGVGWVVLVELDGFLQNSGPSFCWANFEGHQIFDDEDLSFPPKNKTGWLYCISWLVGWLGGMASRGSKMGELVLAAWKNGVITSINGFSWGYFNPTNKG